MWTFIKWILILYAAGALLMTLLIAFRKIADWVVNRSERTAHPPFNLLALSIAVWPFTLYAIIRYKIDQHKKIKRIRAFLNKIEDLGEKLRKDRGEKEKE